MDRRLRTLLLAAPLLALASCQLVSGLSGVDLEGGSSSSSSGGQDFCTRPPPINFNVCPNLFADEDLTSQGCSGVSDEKKCNEQCSASAFALGCGEKFFASPSCNSAASTTCIGDCKQTCACGSKPVNCFDACQATCEDACSSHHNLKNCPMVCAGACVAACGKQDATCVDACDGACRATANLDCLGPLALGCAAEEGHNCANFCGSVQSAEIVFCGGQLLEASPDTGCIDALEKAGIKVTTN
jgi:hypothetical protein